MRQGVTYLFVYESPPNLICEPKYANPTNFVSYNFPREKQENFLKMKWILSKNGKFLNFKNHSNGNFF